MDTILLIQGMIIGWRGELGGHPGRRVSSQGNLMLKLVVMPAAACIVIFAAIGRAQGSQSYAPSSHDSKPGGYGPVTVAHPSPTLSPAPALAPDPTLSSAPLLAPTPELAPSPGVIQSPGLSPPATAPRGHIHPRNRRMRHSRIHDLGRRVIEPVYVDPEPTGQLPPYTTSTDPATAPPSPPPAMATDQLPTDGTPYQIPVYSIPTYQIPTYTIPTYP